MSTSQLHAEQPHAATEARPTRFRRARVIAVRTFAFVMIYIGLMPQALMRASADDVGFPRWPLDRLDALLGAGALPSAHLQSWLSEVGPHRTPVDWFAILVYVLWMPVGLVTLWYVVRARWDRFPGFAWTWFGIWYLTVIAFVLMPVEPPWMHAGVERTLADRLTSFVDIDPNPVAAFPSLHVGMPAALAFQARAAGMRRWSQALFVFVALTAFAVVQLGEHYVVDAVAGIAFAWLVVRLVSRFAPIAAAVDAPEVESLEAAEQPRAA